MKLVLVLLNLWNMGLNLCCNIKIDKSRSVVTLVTWDSYKQISILRTKSMMLLPQWLVWFCQGCPVVLQPTNDVCLLHPSGGEAGGQQPQESQSGTRGVLRTNLFTSGSCNTGLFQNEQLKKGDQVFKK